MLKISYIAPGAAVEKPTEQPKHSFKQDALATLEIRQYQDREKAKVLFAPELAELAKKAAHYNELLFKINN